MQYIALKFKCYVIWFWEALFPPKCLICKKEGQDLCIRHSKFDPAPKNAVDYQYVKKVVAATRYREKTAKKVVEYFKFRGFRHLSILMATEINRHLSKELLRDAVLVPIPLHWTRCLWRGFNQAEILTRSLVEINSEIKYLKDLKRIKRTKQQARLGKSGRLKNLEKAFVWKGKSVPKKVILVDDVVASGSTLDMAAKVLKQAGVKEVYGIVFARGGK